MGIYSELRGYVLAHRQCGEMDTEVGPQTDGGERGPQLGPVGRQVILTIGPRHA